MKRQTGRLVASVLFLSAGMLVAPTGQAHDPWIHDHYGPGYGRGYGYGMMMHQDGRDHRRFRRYDRPVIHYHFHYYGMGPGMMMGPGMGYGMGYGMGPGMMVPGEGGDPRTMGPGMMGPGMRHGRPREVSIDDVRRMLDRHLAWQNNPNLKVGKVEEKDDDTIVGEIVTKDGSLVDRLEFDRRTGRMRRAN